MDVLCLGVVAAFAVATWGFLRLCERVLRMTSLLILGGVLSALLLGYLLFALLFPERLS